MLLNKKGPFHQSPGAMKVNGSPQDAHRPTGSELALPGTLLPGLISAMLAQHLWGARDNPNWELRRAF